MLTTVKDAACCQSTGANVIQLRRSATEIYPEAGWYGKGRSDADWARSGGSGKPAGWGAAGRRWNSQARTAALRDGHWQGWGIWVMSAGMAENVFRHAHRVTYAECTIGNHVYYARYLDILEEARGEFFRKLGQPLLRWQQGDVGLPVAECQVRYRVPARYDDVLQVEVTVIQLSRVRVTFNYSIWKGEGELVLEASTVHFAAGADEKPKRIPEELAAVLNEVLAGREGKSQKLETPRPDGNS